MAGKSGGILGWAQAGSFSVDTTTARAMMMSIGEVRERLMRQLRRIDLLETRAKLGDLPEAQRIAELDVEVAAGDHRSLSSVLQRFAEALDQAHQALEIGMRNYEQIEEQARQDFERRGNS